MRKPWAVLIALVALLAAAAAVEAVPSSQCPDGGGTQYIVEAADAGDLAEGYNNFACDLIIKASITPAIADVFFRARSITIDPAPGPGPVTIIDNLSTGAKVHLLAVNNIVLDRADVRAPKEIEIKCSGPGCTVTITNSVVISSATLECGQDTGEVDIKADGDILITGSSVWGGKFLYFISTAGNVTWHCVPGTGACTDPSIPPFPPIIVAQCEDPQNPGQLKFPCDVTFADLGAVRSVCFPQGDPVCCGGGEAEVHLFAGADKTVDIEDSLLDLRGKVLVRARILKASKTIIPNADSINFQVFGSTTETPVQLREAELTANGAIRIVALVCPPLPPAPGGLACIDAALATIIGGGSVGFPTINGDNTPDYDPNVNDTALECAPDPAATINKGKAINPITAAGTTGLVSLCGAQLNNP
jgi:hypothetical protein